MQISKISSNSHLGIVADNKQAYSLPAFRGEEDKVEISKEAVIEQPKASTGKKWGVGIASAVIPGLGQFINGDTGKGFTFLGIAVGAATVSRIAYSKNRTILPLVIIGSIGYLANKVFSVIDAVKNAKSKVGKS